MNTERLLKLASPYLIVILLDSISGYFIYNGKSFLVELLEISEYDSLIVINNFGLIFQIIVMVMLFSDLRKHGIRYYLIPFAGLLLPLLGVTMYLLVMINKETQNSPAEERKDLS